MATTSFEEIASQLEKKLPFVAYRKPKEATINVIFQEDDQLNYLQDYTETGFVFAPFDTKSPTVLIRPDKRFELTALSETNVDSAYDALPQIDEAQKEFHIDLVKSGIVKIKSGSFEKVVLSRRMELETNITPINLFKNLLERYANALCYLWYHPKIGMWLGATPEILLMVKNRQFTTMSLAGTLRFSENENPKWGNKELEEQELVTKYILDVLANKVSNLKRMPTESVRAGNLLHLRTKISGNIPDRGLGKIIKALHPTPAICGLPQQSTKDFILENEKYDREFYTGYLGELNLKVEKKRSTRTANQENQAYRARSTTTTLFVNLRCMQLKDRQAFIYVGGGITKDSNAAREWEETVEKSKTMLRILMP